MVVRRQLEQLRSELLLPADDTAPARARQAIRALLGSWGLTALVDPVQLAVSELVTNAVRYGQPPVRLTARTDGTCLSVAVHDDGDPLLRTAAHPAPDAESGRGLAILAALGQHTGTRPDRPGKVVWVQFPLGACRGEPLRVAVDTAMIVP